MSKEIIECDRYAWTPEFCDWSGTYDEAGSDDGGAIIYCPKCEWIIEASSVSVLFSNSPMKKKPTTEKTETINTTR